MKNLLMISGDRSFAEGKHGAFYNTLEEFHKYWDRIDIICPSITNYELRITNLFGNVFIHSSPWPLIFQPFWIYHQGLRILKIGNWKLENDNWVMTVHEYPPFYNGIGAYLLHVATKAPYVIEIMHIPGFPKSGSSKEVIYKYLTKFFISLDTLKARAVRVINQKQTRDFLIKAGIPALKIKYIPAFYIDLNIFKPQPLEKKYDLIYIARLEKNKGIGLLLEAVKFSILNLQFPVKLLIVGEGSLKNELIQYVEKNRLKDNVFFSGWVNGPEDVAQLLNESRVFVNPSLNEGGPRVALEAMACGLPVVTTPVGLMLDIIKNKENGLFTDWSSKDMAEKIGLLLKDDALQNQFSKAGLELVKQFEKKSTIKNYADSLKQLIS